MKKIINTKNASAPIGPYSQAVWAGDFLFLSGVVAIIPATGETVNTGIADETHQVMKNINAVLTEAGLNFSHIVKTTVFLTDMSNFTAMNEVYGSYFKNNYPARETVEVSKLPKGVSVEITVTAFKD